MHSGVFRNGSPWADLDVLMGQQGAFVQAKGSLATSLPAVPACDYAGGVGPPNGPAPMPCSR